MNINRQEISRLAGFVGAAMLIAGYVRHTIQELWGPFNLTLIIAGAALLLVSIVLNFGTILDFFRGRSGKLGTNTVALSVAVLAILSIVNFLGYRYHKRFDLTTEGLNTLSDQTKKIVGGLQKDVKVIRFDKVDDQRLADMMREYKFINARVTYERVDPQLKPELGQKYQVKRMPDTVVTSGERVERPQADDEQSVTNALMKVTRDKLKTICFIEGHGEKDLGSQEADGYASIDKAMKSENYEVKSVNLVSSNKVPEDCAAIVVAGPTKEFFPQEADLIGKYLDGGGKALIMLDPGSDGGLNNLLKNWNIILANDTVIDVSGVGRLFGTGPAVPLVTNYGAHPITKDLNRVATFFPFARSVDTGESAKGEVVFIKMLNTSEASWAETELKGNEAKFDEGKDKKGPVSLGVAMTKTLGENQDIRLVVIGDSDFATNNYAGKAGNGDLFLNTVNWLAQDEDLIAIRPKSPTNRSITLSESQQKTFFLLTVLLMPLVVIGTGVWIWWKRR
ncbi:MAG: GldG family protein [Acidobacteria bacterium]|nr:GldG family protein [Acidobacteriota bacterium]